MRDFKPMVVSRNSKIYFLGYIHKDDFENAIHDFRKASDKQFEIASNRLRAIKRFRRISPSEMFKFSWVCHITSTKCEILLLENDREMFIQHLLKKFPKTEKRDFNTVVSSFFNVIDVNMTTIYKEFDKCFKPLLVRKFSKLYFLGYIHQNDHDYVIKYVKQFKNANGVFYKSGLQSKVLEVPKEDKVHAKFLCHVTKKGHTIYLSESDAERLSILIRVKYPVGAKRDYEEIISQLFPIVDCDVNDFDESSIKEFFEVKTFDGICYSAEVTLNIFEEEIPVKELKPLKEDDLYYSVFCMSKIDALVEYGEEIVNNSIMEYKRLYDLFLKTEVTLDVKPSVLQKYKSGELYPRLNFLKEIFDECDVAHN